MKTTCLLLSALLLCLCITAPAALAGAIPAPAQAAPFSITFQISDVEPAKEKLETVDALKALDTAIPHLEACATEHDRLLDFPFPVNHVIASASLAFRSHRPLVLSPDIIWLLISQGFAEHVNRSPEELRHRIVNHQGKIELKVQRDDFVKGSPNNPWQEVFPAFYKQMEARTKNGICQWLVPRFSTTGPVIKAAYEVTLMDAMSPYFAYKFRTLCGIPAITLEGTREDWEDLARRAERLADYGMGGWADTLRPILGQFIDAYDGKVDKDFWCSVFSRFADSGETVHVTGWLIEFFPFSPREKGFDSHDRPVVKIDRFPSGLSKADFLWEYYDEEYDMELVAGFVGIHQDEKTLALRPEIGWAVREQQYNKDNQAMGGPFNIALAGFTLNLLLFLPLAFPSVRRRLRPDPKNEYSRGAKASLAIGLVLILAVAWLIALARCAILSGQGGFIYFDLSEKLALVCLSGMLGLAGLGGLAGVVLAIASLIRKRARTGWVAIAGLAINIAVPALVAVGLFKSLFVRLVLE